MVHKTKIASDVDSTKSIPDIKAVVFDIDGTLIDTSEYIAQAFEHTIAHHGFPVRDRAAIASQIGRKLEECYAFLAPGSEFVRMKQTHDEFQTANLHLIKPFTYTNEMLKQLHDNGLRLALWTSRGHNVGESLACAGIDTKFFDMIVDPTHKTNHKPDPEGLQLIAGEWRLSLRSLAMIGDAPVDVEAGKKAGVGITVAITHGFGTRQDLEAAAPDYIINSLRELPGIFDSWIGRAG